MHPSPMNRRHRRHEARVKISSSDFPATSERIIICVLSRLVGPCNIVTVAPIFVLTKRKNSSALRIYVCVASFLASLNFTG